MSITLEVVHSRRMEKVLDNKGYQIAFRLACERVWLCNLLSVSAGEPRPLLMSYSGDNGFVEGARLMAFFADLTGYAYGLDEPDVLNIGWLGKPHEFTIGPTSTAFRIALEELCDNPILLHRGVHRCDFCKPANRATGNGQIRLEHQDGQVFAAPTMVYHYVTAHDYKPPDTFIEAVLNPRQIIGE